MRASDRRQLAVELVQFGQARNVLVSYAQPMDVRAGGNLAVQHQIAIAGPEYRDGIEAVLTAVQDLLADALEDFESSSTYQPTDDEEDDEKGMGE